MRLSGYAVMACFCFGLSGCFYQADSTRSSDVNSLSKEGGVDFDETFSIGDNDNNDVLNPLEIERLGLGGNWHTLDADGDGNVTKKEFKKQFASSNIQHSIRAENKNSATLDSAVSASFDLPAEKPVQHYRAVPLNPAASTTLPINAPLVIPIFIDESVDSASDNE